MLGGVVSGGTASLDGPTGGSSVSTFTVASDEFVGDGKEKGEYQCKGKV
jgi:hypothetical protein